MSTESAISSVTASIKSLLENGLAHHALVAQLGDVRVTAQPPDRIPTDAEEIHQINVFLYRITPNTSQRTQRPAESEAERAARGFAVDLHYLLTTYAPQDLDAHTLLDAIILILRQAPELPRDAKRSALAHSAAAAPLPRMTPEFVSMEELSRLWSSLQARFRVSLTYQVCGIPIDQ